MPSLPLGAGSLHFEVSGSGYPVLLFAPGFLSSRIERWRGNPARPGVAPDWVDPIPDIARLGPAEMLDPWGSGHSDAAIARVLQFCSITRRRPQHDPADLVIVTVKVRAHRELVLGALAAGKHVFCEWLLGLDAAEAEEMLHAVQAAGVHYMVGLQGRVHPGLLHVKALVDRGEIGTLLSCSLVSSPASWAPRLPQAEAYRADRSGGATGLT